MIDHLSGSGKRRLKQKLATLLPLELKPKGTNFLELGLLWEGELDFDYLNNDFAGASGTIMKSDALNFLASSFASFDLKHDWEQDLYKIISQDLKSI